MQRNISIKFTEVEHFGDVEEIKTDIRTAGGHVYTVSLDTAEETCEIIVEASDHNYFKTRFRKTPSFELVEGIL